MTKYKAVFVVGHANWGKSVTIRALTGGLHRYVTIDDVEFHIRRMSNDDDPDGLVDFIGSVEPENHPNLLIALCPNFTDRAAMTEHILATLRRKGYRLFFFVLERQYGSERCVLPSQIARLRTFGRVEVYSGNAQSEVRAGQLRTFISDVVV